MPPVVRGKFVECEGIHCEPSPEAGQGLFGRIQVFRRHVLSHGHVRVVVEPQLLRQRALPNGLLLRITFLFTLGERRVHHL